MLPIDEIKQLKDIYGTPARKRMKTSKDIAFFGRLCKGSMHSCAFSVPLENLTKNRINILFLEFIADWWSIKLQIV